ncbi:MAG: hypothetical protein MZU97_07325 [Bacillus subtilis]|nr:hypothetical protein [Bacillus subtilis]
MDGSLKTWRKGVGEFLVKTRDVPHTRAAIIKQDANAIEEMAHQVIAIQKLTDYSETDHAQCRRHSGRDGLECCPRRSHASKWMCA